MYGEELLDQSFQEDDPEINIRFTDPFTDHDDWTLERSICLVEVRVTNSQKKRAFVQRRMTALHKHMVKSLTNQLIKMRYCFDSKLNIGDLWMALGQEVEEYNIY